MVTTKQEEIDKAEGETDKDKKIDKDERKDRLFRLGDQAESKMRFKNL